MIANSAFAIVAFEASCLLLFKIQTQCLQCLRLQPARSFPERQIPPPLDLPLAMIASHFQAAVAVQLKKEAFG